MYKKSKDTKVATPGIEVRTGSRSNVSLELQIAEEWLKHKDPVGKVTVDHPGKGYCINKYIRRTTREELRVSKMAGLSQ